MDRVRCLPPSCRRVPLRSFPNVLVYVISSHFGVNECKSVRFELSSSRAYFQCTSLGCRVLSRDSSVTGIHETFIRELSLLEPSAKILSRENFSPYGKLPLYICTHSEVRRLCMSPQQGQLFKGLPHCTPLRSWGWSWSCLTQLDMHVVV